MLADLSTVGGIAAVLADVEAVIGLAAYLGAAVTILWVYSRSKSLTSTLTAAVVAIAAAWVVQPANVMHLARLAETNF